MQIFLRTSTRMHASPHTRKHAHTRIYSPVDALNMQKWSSKQRQEQQGEAGAQAAAELLTDRNDDSQNSHGDVVANEVVITASWQEKSGK